MWGIQQDVQEITNRFRTSSSSIKKPRMPWLWLNRWKNIGPTWHDTSPEVRAMLSAFPKTGMPHPNCPWKRFLERANIQSVPRCHLGHCWLTLAKTMPGACWPFSSLPVPVYFVGIATVQVGFLLSWLAHLGWASPKLSTVTMNQCCGNG